MKITNMSVKKFNAKIRNSSSLSNFNIVELVLTLTYV